MAPSPTRPRRPEAAARTRSARAAPKRIGSEGAKARAAPKRIGSEGAKARAASAGEIVRSKRFGTVDPSACAALRDQREASGLSRHAMAYLAWSRLGVRVKEQTLASVEHGRAPITPLVRWIYEQVATPREVQP